MAGAGACTRSTSHILAVAFDFGTTYSGYAFSFRNDPLKVQINNNWNAGSEELVSLKTPTCVLLSPDRQFHSFGYEAENKYSELAFDEELSGWLLFIRFKTMLYKQKKLSREAEIYDINGNPMLAMTIFSMSIRYLKDHFLALLDKQVTGVTETDIQYVLTVPAIWDDSAKQFMREAAIGAGIDTARLRLALEPEAASVWCQTLTEESMTALTESGSQYMVVDLGGGTVDVSVHRTDPDGTLSELHKASGGPWGGTNVDNNYIAWLTQLFGQRAVERFKVEDMASYFDLLRELETNKRSVRFDNMGPLLFRISATLKEISEEEEGKTLSARIVGHDIVVKRDKMKIDPTVVRQWFDGPVDNIIGHIKGILSEPSMDRVGTILLVGGFAESKYVQEKIMHAFNFKRFIIPHDAGLTVLKGAVRFGHEPTIISTRVMNYTYGIRQHEDFDPLKYPLSRMVFINGEKKVSNIFKQLVCAGETVRVGHEAFTFGTPADMERSVVPVLRSINPNPTFTTDLGCEELGILVVDHPEGDTLEDKIMKITISFGDTELRVKSKITKTGKEVQTIIDCLK